MECLDELEHPLLAVSPKHSHVGGLLRGALVRCEQEKSAPLMGWQSYCTSTDTQQQQKQQLLDPCSLPSTLESLYPPAPAWGPADALGLHTKDYLETTFVDIGPGSPLERKLLAETRDIHSVSYSMEDEDDLLPDFEVRPVFLNKNTVRIFCTPCPPC